MQKIRKLYADSIMELKVTKNMVICAFMAALAVVLSYTTSIEVGPYIRIGFSGLPNRIVESYLDLLPAVSSVERWTY